MRFLVGLASSLLSLLLFFSLSTFGLAFMLQRTILNRDFVITELSKLDVSSLVRETIVRQIGQQIAQQLGQQVGQQIPGVGDRVAAAINTAIHATITELDPWTKKQVNDLVITSYDYLAGQRQNLDLVLSLDTVKYTLSKNLRQTILQTPELAQVPAAMRDPVIEGILQSITGQLPASFDLNQSLSPEVRTTLAGVRQGVSYFPTLYWGLVGLMLFLILGIILINRNIKVTARSLGSTFLSLGAFEYAGILVTKYLMGAQSPSFGLPPPLQKWLLQFLSNLWAPLEMFCIVVAIAGLGLLIVSFLLRRPAPAQG